VVLHHYVESALLVGMQVGVLISVTHEECNVCGGGSR